MIAHDPLHGSGQAELPHPALALGYDAHAAQRIGMTDVRPRQPAVDEAPHGRHHLRQEPDAVAPLVRIRGGGHE